MTRPLITLTTDFGLSSPYVAQMKGTILSICREVDLVDISHAIAPQNVREGAFVLADSTPRFPAESIHIAVVDPGVGTSRKLVYAEIGTQRYLAPDNGLLSVLLQQHPLKAVVTLENRDYWLPGTTATFHGRDILSPVAAHLALAVAPAELGPPQKGIRVLEWPPVERSAHAVRGQVIHIDSFGNLITNLSREELDRLGQSSSLIVRIRNREVRGLVYSYGSALEGELVALFDSAGRLEIAIVGNSAAARLGIGVGEPVEVLAT
jgi:S-adenosylmethionine hydrolase